MLPLCICYQLTINIRTEEKRDGIKSGGKIYLGPRTSGVSAQAEDSNRAAQRSNIYFLTAFCVYLLTELRPSKIEHVREELNPSFSGDFGSVDVQSCCRLPSNGSRIPAGVENAAKNRARGGSMTMRGNED